MKYIADVVVVGAGIIGCSIALELARDGREVCVVDKSGGIGHGSTGASSGVVRFHYSTYTGVATSWEAMHGWREWADHLQHLDPAGLASFQRTGMLVLDREPGASKPITDLFARVGVPWEEWDAATMEDRLPYVDPRLLGPPAPVDSDAFFADAGGPITGTFTPDAGYVGDPQLAAQNLGVAAQHFGAKFLLRRKIEQIEMAGPRRWRVAAAGGDFIEADVVVNAAGPWSSGLNDLAGVGAGFTVSSRPLRQEVHQVTAPAGFCSADGGPGISIADPDLGVYMRPSGANGLLVGGMEPECDPLEWIEDPDAFNPNPTATGYAAQIMRAARRLPALAVPNRPSGVAGVYDATTDWTPIYDKTERPGLYVAMGTSGHQFKAAPVVGTLMRELIDAVESGRDHDHDPVCVRLPRTGSVVDMSAYSRLRPVGANSPTGVMG